MRMIQGSCHCGAVQWRFDGIPASAMACNCTVCRRYAVLWAYDYDGERIIATGGTHTYVWGRRRNGFNFCPECGCVAFWRALAADGGGRRRMAVNLRLAEPQTVAKIPVERIDGLGQFQFQPRDGRCVADYWL
jgi:hypothetical protein